MINIIEKQIEFLEQEREKVNIDDEKISDLIHILELFKDVLKSVLNEQHDSNELSKFILQFINLKGNVNIVSLLKEFMKIHKLQQVDIMNYSGINQVQISNFLNNKHSMQTNNIEKILNYESSRKVE